mmetsp:Transcript_7378/g.26352  ORF Transcript_7378/g.26352 Transcript_7378/m.26352 type:complete len:140 (-) Transcript_7378:118-537(-)
MPRMSAFAAAAAAVLLLAAAAEAVATPAGGACQASAECDTGLVCLRGNEANAADGTCVPHDTGECPGRVSGGAIEGIQAVDIGGVRRLATSSPPDVWNIDTDGAGDINVDDVKYWFFPDAASHAYLNVEPCLEGSEASD